jgi:hypothetical protein
MQIDSLQIDSSQRAAPTPLELAKAKLVSPKRPERPLAAVAAAALFAVSALVFATAAILAPPTTFTPMAKPGVQY